MYLASYLKQFIIYTYLQVPWTVPLVWWDWGTLLFSRKMSRRPLAEECLTTLQHSYPRQGLWYQRSVSVSVDVREYQPSQQQQHQLQPLQLLINLDWLFEFYVLYILQITEQDNFQSQQYWPLNAVSHFLELCYCVSWVCGRVRGAMWLPHSYSLYQWNRRE